MYIMTGHAFNFSIIEFYAVVKAVWGVWRAEVNIFKTEASILHGYRVVVSQVCAEHFNANVVCNLTIVAFAAAFNIVVGADAHVQGAVLRWVESDGFEDDHIDRHRTIVAGQTQHADRVGVGSFVVQVAAIVELIVAEGGYVAVPAIDATEIGWVCTGFFGGDVALFQKPLKPCNRGRLII